MQDLLIDLDNTVYPEDSNIFAQIDLKMKSFIAKNLNVSKGDRVCLYMQMIPELPVAMLACARIGAVHSVVFGAFSPDSLRDRINDSKCKLLITQDTGCLLYTSPSPRDS